MPKEYFSIDNCTSLKDIAPNSKIHMIGVCGVAMGQLAIALAEQGYQVSGSDSDYYEPMASMLEASPVKTRQGYDLQHVPEEVSLIVIGNVAPYENEEVLSVEKKGLAYTFFSKLLNELIITDRHSVVVSGTHGKTSTSAMIAFMLAELEEDPSFFVGGAVEGLTRSLQLGQGAYSIVEGDEYDSAFFAKTPKFHFYAPDTLIITSLEFDHADIFSSLSDIKEEFSKLIASLPSSSTVVCCIDCDNVKRFMDEISFSNIVTYGQDIEADFQILKRKTSGLKQKVYIKDPRGNKLSFNLSLPGHHNACNALAGLIVCHSLGINWERAVAKLALFSGVKRRQELRYDQNGITLIEDFAHHPSAVKETIAAIKCAYPDRRLWAVFEPRSNTSRRACFQDDYAAAFDDADRVVLCEVSARNVDASSELLDVSKLCEDIEQRGKAAISLENALQIKKRLLAEVKAGDVVLVMSNGSFGGLIDMLVQGFSGLK